MKLARVDIDRSRRSRSFAEDERLWSADLKRMIDMILEHGDHLRSFYKGPEGKDRSSLDRAPNLSLAVFGPAGSGKSSLLKTLVFEAQNPDPINPRMKGVASLDVLQPARFGPDDHLLYATVAASLDAHHQKRGAEFEYEVMTDVLRAYRDLSLHLRAIRPEEIASDLEPHALAAEVVQRHTSGLKLRAMLDRFFSHLADDLNGTNGALDRSSVVLLPVDDLDLNPQHLYQGLRQLQAYLLHPRIVPVFCFTDRLAEEILAGAYAKLVKHADVKRRRTSRLSVSEQLAVQYLSKCFPIRNRIRLGPIAATLQAGELRLGASGEEKSEAILLTLATASVLLYGVPDRAARHPVRAALRPSTLRRQFHVLDAMRQARVEQLIDPRIRTELLKLEPADPSRNAPAATGEEKPEKEHPWGFYFNRATWALMNVHRDVLREYAMHLEELYSWTPQGLRRVLLDTLFGLPAKAQVGLWQRWRSLTDSRRSQVISLLAANAYRPWLEGDEPSGEDYAQLAAARAKQAAGTASPGDPPIEPATEQKIEAPIALLWFLNLTTGFYLPFSRSVYRQIRDTRSESKEPLSGAGWSFHSAPIHAAQAADDDRKLFPTGMMFLDPFSYATALTTAPRIAACRVLDHASLTEGEGGSEEARWNLIKKAKVAFLSTSTRTLVGDDPDRNEPLEELRKTLGDISLAQALERYEETASWEIGEGEGSQLKRGRTNDEFRCRLREALKNHDYPRALDYLQEPGNGLGAATRKHNLEKVRGLAAAAMAVHDDQLLLRIWTCYGYNRGRFWAAVSLWRGLALIGQLIESYRKWISEAPASSRSAIIQRITGLLHTHSLRGLVPGKDLGEPQHQGTLELAFSAWNTPGQRQAIWRLATRLESWLRGNKNIDVYPLQEAEDLLWSRCFVRRLHGGYIIGALWQWLDAEHLEHQGEQYGKRRRYYWNAGVALTSWLRVLQRYFGGTREIRWLLETCPLTGPFLSRSPRDPFLARLCDRTYDEVLRFVAKDGESESEDRKMRIARRFRGIAQDLQALWLNRADFSKLTELVSLELPAEALEKWRKSGEDPEWSTRAFWKGIVTQIITGLFRPVEDSEPWREFFGSLNNDDYQRVVSIAQRAREEVLGDEESGVRESLLDSFNPRVLEPGVDGEDIDEDKDILDPDSACFEIASTILQHWKIAAHASAASLFYQIPRVRRTDFFDRDDSAGASKS